MYACNFLNKVEENPPPMGTIIIKRLLNLMYKDGCGGVYMSVILALGSLRPDLHTCEASLSSRGERVPFQPGIQSKHLPQKQGGAWRPHL